MYDVSSGQCRGVGLSEGLNTFALWLFFSLFCLLRNRNAQGTMALQRWICDGLLKLIWEDLEGPINLQVWSSSLPEWQLVAMFASPPMLAMATGRERPFEEG